MSFLISHPVSSFQLYCVATTFEIYFIVSFIYYSYKEYLFVLIRFFFQSQNSFYIILQTLLHTNSFIFHAYISCKKLFEIYFTLLLVLYIIFTRNFLISSLVNSFCIILQILLDTNSFISRCIYDQL